jgi:DNA-binding GntR family transcriptional regulator
MARTAATKRTARSAAAAQRPVAAEVVSAPPARKRAAVSQRATRSKGSVKATSKSSSNALGKNGGSDAAPATSTARIAESITTAIVERRLMPGTKLVEQKLADIFKVSRTIVRQALNQLSRDQLITLSPARGAHVATPSVEEARQVFEVRQMLESSLVKRLATTISADQVAQLRAHLADEAAAVQRIDVPGRTRLLADFHTVLAQLLGNQALAQLLGDLLTRCSLIALMFQSSHSAEHSHAEHVAIVDALERHDARAAVKLMDAHLQHVIDNLQLDPRVPDLVAVLKG